MPAALLADLERRLAAERRAVEVPPDARRAAVAAVLRGDPRDPDLLLMRRAERRGDRWSGQVSLPGGHQEEDDDGPVGTAVRETREEVGLDLSLDTRIVGELTTLQALARGRRVDTWITPVVFHHAGAQDLELGPEASDAFWLPLGAVRRGELDAEHRYDHEGVVLRLPSWRHGTHVVWGLTHRIVSDLLRHLP